MIFTGFLPNATKQDLLTAIGYFLLPWKWGRVKNGEYIKKSENYLESYFKTKSATTFDSGRSALHFALKALGVGEGDEVIVQAYTCVVVINAIRWTGAKPIYVDINSDFNIDVNSLNTKITQKTKVIIIQHTFGVPADLNKILDIAKAHNIKTIEDCAHSLGIKYNNKLTGTIGDIGMFSFGTDKIISCMRGGALITNDENLAEKIKNYQKDLPHMKLINIWQHAKSYPIFAIGKALYRSGIGKLILATTKALHITLRIIDNCEKQGQKPKKYPAKMPNIFANILFNQLTDLDEQNKHREKISQIYFENIKNDLLKIPANNNQTFLRFPILTDKPQDLMKYLKKHGVIAGNWYNTVIAPHDIDWTKTGYTTGLCTMAEELSPQSVNLPTNRHITEKDALYIAKIVNNYAV